MMRWVGAGSIAVLSLLASTAPAMAVPIACTPIGSGGFNCVGFAQFLPVVHNGPNGRINIGGGATILKDGQGRSIVNTGTLGPQGSIVPIYASSATIQGHLFNSGTISGGGNGAVVFLNTTLQGNFHNTGTIRDPSFHTFYFASGTWTGNFINSGTMLTETFHNIHISANWTGNFVNSGRIAQTQNVLSDNVGVLIDGDHFTGNFENSGIIESVSAATVEIVTSFTGNIRNSGTIRNRGTVGSNGTGFLFACTGATPCVGTFENSGTIEALTATANAGVHFISGPYGNIWQGNISNLAGGTITGGLAGLLINCGGNCSGTIRNSGKIEATRSSGGGVDLNGYRSNASSWTGDFINEAGGQILGVNGASSGAFPSEAAGAFIHIPQFNGNIINRGLVKGFKWGIALGNTLPSVIFRMTGAVRNEAGGEITALAANGTALFIDANANAANFGSHVVDGGIDNAGTIRGGSGAEGAGIRLDGVRLGAALRNSGIIEATTAIDLAFAGGLTNFIQTAGLTRGNIDSNQSHAPNPSDPRPELGFADVIRFTGGRFEGNIIPDTLDQVFIGENGGASNRTVAFVSGVTQGLSSLTIQSGIALLGTTAKGVNGAGYFFNGLGTLNVAGGAELYLDDDTRINANTVNLAAGSTLNYFLTTDTTKNGKIFSAVNANIRTANLKITLDPVTFAQTVGRQFVFTKLIDSPNLDGPFATVSLDGAGSTFRVAQTFVPNNSSITLTITRFALTELPNLTRPSRPVADVLEDIISGGGPIGPDLEEALDSILAAPNPTDSVRWLEELSGARAAEVLASSRRTDDPFKSLVSDRVAAVKATGCKVAGFMWCEPRYASVSPEKQSDADDPFGWITKGVRQSGKTSAWGRAIGSWSDRNAGNTVRLLGGIAGADFVVDAETLIGAAFQFTDSHSDLGGADDFGDVQSYQFGGYGSWGDTNFFVNANLSGIWHKFDSSRSITIGGRRRIAKADYDGQAVSAALEAGTVIEADGVRFQPLASLSFVRQWTEDYRETGAGGLSLDVKGRETDSLRSSIGGRAAFPVAMGSSKAIVEGRAAWVHEFLDTQTSFSASFVDAPGARFITTSEKAPRDQAVVGAGIVVPVADNANLFVDYDASLSRDAITHTGAVGLRVTW